MAKKSISFLTLAALLLTGCGGTSTPAVVQAAAPPPFPMAAQAWNCDGDYTLPQGAYCRESDGKTYYILIHWNVTIRPDGHGTFLATTEQGNNAGAYHAFTLPLPQKILVAEIHPTLHIEGYCPTLVGVQTGWNGDHEGLSEHLMDDIHARFTAGDTDESIPQTVFPVPVPVAQFDGALFTDLCGTATIHWSFQGSF